MTEHKDLEQPDEVSNSDKDTVDLWQPHPSHKPLPQLDLLSRTERRLPENARIRRWMDLGDQALRSDSDDDPPSE